MSATRFGARWSLRGEGAASRATMTMVDQCVASASNFSVGIVVARITGPAGLGAFALAYTVWILVTTLHRSMITDPMAIMGDIRGEERDKYIRRGFAADVVLGVMASSAVAVMGAIFLVAGQHTFGIGLLSVAPWIVVLDLQDYWRWIGFMMGKPRKSLMNDLLFNAVQAVAFGAVFVLGLHSVFAVVSAWGLGAAVAAVYGLRQFSVRPSIRGGSAFLWSRWPTSRWLAGERGASWGGVQLYLIVAGAILGPAALGGIKAAQGLVIGPTILVINGAGSFGLPEATRQLAERGWTGMIRITRLVTAAGVSVAMLCAVAVLFAAPTLLRVLYGPAFVPYAPSARLFAIAIAIAAFGVGPTLTLTATRRIVPLFVVQLARMVLVVTLTFLLAKANGPTGVATVNLVGCAATLVAMWIIQSRARRSVEAAQAVPELQIEAAQPTPEMQIEATQPTPEMQIEVTPATPEMQIEAIQSPKVQLKAEEKEVQKLLDALEGEIQRLIEAVERFAEQSPRGNGETA
jgi:O-antigen/teichoic acid export membrane protein